VGPIQDNIHASYASVLLSTIDGDMYFVTLAFYAHMYFVYTCFLCRYFSSTVDGDTHASYASILYHSSFIRVVHMLFMQVFSSSVHGNTHASYASVFCRPYMMRTQIFISEFFRAIIWTMIPLGCSILHLSFES
jgi:hypothetical protein